MELLKLIAEWAEEHPTKAMFFINIPVCIITSFLTNLLLS